MVDSDAFSNANRLIIFLITGFLRISESLRSKSLWFFSLGNLKYIFGTFFTKEFTASYKNKTPMGHIAHPRKPFKSISTYNYHYEKPIISIL